MAKLPQIGHCTTIKQFLAEIEHLCNDNDVTGIAIVLSRQNGNAYTSHQYGMNATELAISSTLLDDYANWVILDHTLN